MTTKNLDLKISKAGGIWHLTNAASSSRLAPTNESPSSIAVALKADSSEWEEIGGLVPEMSGKSDSRAAVCSTIDERDRISSKT